MGKQEQYEEDKAGARRGGAQSAIVP